MSKKPRQIVIPLDEGETAIAFVWHNQSSTLYEISLTALDGEILHCVERLKKPGEKEE